MPDLKSQKKIMAIACYVYWIAILREPSWALLCTTIQKPRLQSEYSMLTCTKDDGTAFTFIDLGTSNYFYAERRCLQIGANSIK